MAYRLLSIILPVYNQADHVDEVVRDYVRGLSKLPLPYEVILSVNGSTDQSLSVCQTLAQEFESIKVVHSIRGGWGLGVKMGLENASGDLLCYTNSARTSSQDLVLLLLYAVVNPDVIIKANRKIRESATRRLGSLLFNIECRMLFDLSYWDINGTPKVFPRSFDKLLNLTREDDLIDLEFNVICRQQNYPMLEVPIFSTKRHGGRSTTKVDSALRLYWGAYRLKQTTYRGGI